MNACKRILPCVKLNSNTVSDAFVSQPAAALANGAVSHFRILNDECESLGASGLANVAGLCAVPQSELELERPSDRHALLVPEPNCTCLIGQAVREAKAVSGICITKRKC